MATMDLVQWLGEQLDEDERIARTASHVLRDGAYWSLDEWHGREQPHSLIAQGTAEQPVALGHFTADPVPTEQAAHIVRHDPARVLREIDAKRRIITAYENYDQDAPELDVPHSVLQLLALPYADRPGYQELWRI